MIDQMTGKELWVLLLIKYATSNCWLKCGGGDAAAAATAAAAAAAADDDDDDDDDAAAADDDDGDYFAGADCHGRCW